MGECSNCKKKIEYNKFKRYRGKILCYNCYDTRLERKKAKRIAAELEKTVKEKEIDVSALTKDYSPFEEAKKTEEEVTDNG